MEKKQKSQGVQKKPLFDGLNKSVSVTSNCEQCNMRVHTDLTVPASIKLSQIHTEVSNRACPICLGKLHYSNLHVYEYQNEIHPFTGETEG